MPIEFNCPACQKQYRVKEELAGKTARCGKCSHRMQIPRPAPPENVELPELEPALGGWSDDELRAPAPVAPKPAAAPSMCKECGAPMAGDAVVCMLCGYDKRTGTVRAIKTAGGGKARERSASSGMASLIRGTIFSFMGAVLGAVIWAVIAWLTDRQFGIIAWALGGLAGGGMAFGHEDDDGTTAGIIAAGMSLVGIVMAKILIVVIVVAAAVANLPAEPVKIDYPTFQRAMLAAELADESLKRQGLDPATASEDQQKQARTAARAEVDKMSQQEVETRYAKRLAAAEAEADQDPDPQPVDQKAEMPAITEIQPAGGQENPGLIVLFFKLMFSPIDGIFILFAFFTAYRVGSGGMTN